MTSYQVRLFSIGFVLLICTAINPCYAVDLSKVSGLSDFIEIPFNNASRYAEIQITDYINAPSQEFISSAENVLGMQQNESGYLGWYTFGGSYKCNNTIDNSPVLCRYMTGGSPANNQPVCGTSMENSYSYALSNPGNICNAGSLYTSSGVRTWIGIHARDIFIIPESLSDITANRLCVEVEMPSSMVQDAFAEHYSYPAVSDRLQIVNPTGDDNIDLLRFEFGTYTSLYASDQKGYRKNPEGPDDRHFYHKPSRYGRKPFDKGFYLGNNTFLVCMGEMANGVRSGQRPPYYANPLAFAGYMYVPYISRLYLDFKEFQIVHPDTFKVNRVIAFYERNYIQASPYWSSDLRENETASVSYPFSVYNGLSTEATYDIHIISHGDNLSYLGSKANDELKVFVDKNGNGTKDTEDTQEVISSQTITFAANKNMHFIAIHTPDDYSTFKADDYRFSRGTVTFIRQNQMKATSFQMVTWWPDAQGGPSDKETFLASHRYPAQEYTTYAAWNHEKEDNHRLIKNSPDYTSLVGGGSGGGAEVYTCNFAVQKKKKSKKKGRPKKQAKVVIKKDNEVVSFGHICTLWKAKKLKGEAYAAYKKYGKSFKSNNAGVCLRTFKPKGKAKYRVSVSSASDADTTLCTSAERIIKGKKKQKVK